MSSSAQWRIPKTLPECWWMAIHSNNGTVEWSGPYDSRAEVEKWWPPDATDEWIDKPARLEIVAENASSTISRSYGGISNRAAVTARWNWFARHREVLLD